MASFYVSLSGDDTNSGTQLSPWRNPWTIVNRTFAPSDTIFFRGGTYIIQTQAWSASNKPTVHVRQSGTANHPITLRNFPGESPVFDGTSNSGAILGTSDGFSVAFLTFDGIEVTNGTSNLTGIRGVSDQIIFQNLILHNTTLPIADNVSAIRIGGVGETNTNIQIKNCKLYDVFNAAGDANASAITSYFATNVTVENCEMFNTSAGCHLKGPNTTWITRNNFLHDLTVYGWGVSFAPGDVLTDLQVYQNVFASTVSGLKQDSGGDSGQVNNMSTYNNVFYNYSSNALVSPEFQGSTNFRAYNNICDRVGTALNDVKTYDAGPNCSGASVVIDRLNFNLYRRTTGFTVLYGATNSAGVSGCNQTFTTLAAWQASGHGYDQNSLEGLDPLFVGPFTQATGFKLQSGSPAKNLGRVGGSAAGVVVDAGAYPLGSECVGLESGCPAPVIPLILGGASGYGVRYTGRRGRKYG